MAKKDPAFLMYSKDWLEGTAEMTYEEKGLYVEFLCHQHQKGSIPSEPARLARLAGLSEPEFTRIWKGVSDKFIKSDDRMVDRLVNRKLTEVITERSTKTHTNRITGHFAKLIREAKGTPKHIIEYIKSSFKLTDFNHLPTEQATERLTEWFTEMIKNGSKSIEDANTIGNENEIKDEFSMGGAGGKDLSLVSRMEAIWLKTIPTYTKQKTKDSHALKDIADFIFTDAGISGGYGNPELESLALGTFQKIADEVKKETFWVNKPLKSIANHIQEFYNKIKNPTDGAGKKHTNGAKLDDNILKQKLAERIGEWQQSGG